MSVSSGLLLGSFLLVCGFALGWGACILSFKLAKPKPDVVESAKAFWLQSADPHFVEALWNQLGHSKVADNVAREVTKGYYSEPGLSIAKRVGLAKRHIYLFAPDDPYVRARGLAWLSQTIADENAARKMGVDL